MAPKLQAIPTGLDFLEDVAVNTPILGETMTTPADLLSMRLLLGMSREEAGILFNVPASEIKVLESMRTHFVYEGHVKTLETMLTRVSDLLIELTSEGAPKPEFLFTHRNDGAFADYEPKLAEWMKFNSVHQMFIARLQDEWMQLGHRPTIVTVIPTQYEEYLAAHSNQDAPESRAAWARAHLKVVQLRAGMPHYRQSGGTLPKARLSDIQKED